MTAWLPPAVVLGIDSPIGLTIIRDLGRNGVKVYGIGQAGALGARSRYLHHSAIRAEGDSAVVEQLVALAGELDQACLFAVSESDIALLNRHRERLAAYRFTFADQQRMDKALNKDQTYLAAATVGIRVPRTEQAHSMEQAQALSAGLRYPVVLKWANPHAAMDVLDAAGLALDKLHYCDSAAELLAYLRTYQSVGIYPLIQEYCAGYGLGQFILMHKGEARYTFQHRRVHEWPPEGGFSSLCESIPPESHQALMARSVALLRELDWEGVAMVEYRHDPDSGESALMEINGRYWGSLPLAYHAGAAFPWLSYQLATASGPFTAPPYRSGVRCRFMIPETKRLLRILFQQSAIADKSLSFRRVPELLDYLADFVRPRTCYYVFAWNDTAPFVTDLTNAARAAWRRVFAQPAKADGAAASRAVRAEQDAARDER